MHTLIDKCPRFDTPSNRRPFLVSSLALPGVQSNRVRILRFIFSLIAPISPIKSPSSRLVIVQYNHISMNSQII